MKAGNGSFEKKACQRVRQRKRGAQQQAASGPECTRDGDGTNWFGPVGQFDIFPFIFYSFSTIFNIHIWFKKYQELGTITDENPLPMNATLEPRIQ
jgi:hypothetical protein